MNKQKKLCNLKNVLHLSLAASLIYSGMSIAGAAEWSYSGDTGPEHWGDLSPAYSACKLGQEQSPIDLVNASDNEELPALKHKFEDVPLSVVNNGHTIQVNVNNGSFTKSERGKQRLLQFHFHSPSEHTLNGQAYPLEAHFVHVDDAGVLSVVGVFFKQGDKNKALQSILDIAPDHKGEASAEGKTIDPNDVLGRNKTKRYFRLQGSLTTPPCTEGVNWYVSTKIQSLSAEQLSKFESLFHGGNARPVQPLNERTLLLREKD